MFDSLPSGTQMIADIGEYSSPLLGEYWPVVALLAGIVVIGGIIAAVLGAFSRFGHH